MSVSVVVYVLTFLGAVVVALTRLRLGRSEEGGARRVDVGPTWLLAHTVLGSLAVLVWLVFLIGPEDSVPGDPLVGIVALGLWWGTAIAGLMILVRWLPSKGRHAVEVPEDSWSSGPGLSLLAHLGMVVGVAVFTWAYWTAAV
ncbi:unannotated protein [freshwater metagenome]|uniref:Unannotated protein n=1 Tax=freshwater metagenome TaxID=449393 RepID=A0A6J6TGH4_9ZZZZ|nr:hypothetical protein [Actinomycetota bacterium]